MSLLDTAGIRSTNDAQTGHPSEARFTGVFPPAHASLETALPPTIDSSGYKFVWNPQPFPPFGTSHVHLSDPTSAVHDSIRRCSIRPFAHPIPLSIRLLCFSARFVQFHRPAKMGLCPTDRFCCRWDGNRNMVRIRGALCEEELSQEVEIHD
jgi:hypothetical protein